MADQDKKEVAAATTAITDQSASSAEAKPVQDAAITEITDQSASSAEAKPVQDATEDVKTSTEGAGKDEAADGAAASTEEMQQETKTAAADKESEHTVACTTDAVTPAKGPEDAEISDTNTGTPSRTQSSKTQDSVRNIAQGNANMENVTNGQEESSDVSKNGAVVEEKEVDPTLRKKIIQQIEYYFGDYNLPRDKFLSTEIKTDDGWVPLATMLKFVRLANLSSEAAVIAAAIITAGEDTFMEVDSHRNKIRRKPSQPLPELTEGLQEESIKRTVYCKGFPKDDSMTLDILLEYFKQHGPYDSIRMRYYFERSSSVQGFKGSVLVVFQTETIARAFLEGPPVQFKKTYLIRKWFAAYLSEKRKEMDERMLKKQARLEKQAAEGEGKPEQDKKEEFEELPQGIFLRATGFNSATSREDIKKSVFDLTNDCSFVEFSRGDSQAYIRFSEAGSNKQILASLQGNLMVKGKTVEVFLVEGEEEQQQLEKANEARRKAHAAGPYTKKRKGGGGWGGRGGRHKKQRTH